MSGASPRGQASGETTQSPSPAVSSRRAPNHPSSRTNRDADPGSRVGEGRQPVHAMVEIDRFPRVQHHRARPANVLRPRPHVVVERRAQPVEAVAAMGDQDGGRVIPLPRAEADLAGLEQLPPADLGHPLRAALGEPRRAAAEGHVQTGHRAGPEAEARFADDEQGRRVVPGAPVAPLPHPGAHAERAPLGLPLAGPSPGQVEHLGRAVRQRQRNRKRGQQVVTRPVVAQPGRQAQQATPARPDLEAEGEPGVRGVGAQAEAPCGAACLRRLGGHLRELKARAVRRTVRARPLQGGPQRPAVHGEREDAPRERYVGGRVRHRAHRGERDLREVLPGGDRGADVEHDGQPVVGRPVSTHTDGEDEAHVRPVPDLDEPERPGGGRCGGHRQGGLRRSWSGPRTVVSHVAILAPAAPRRDPPSWSVGPVAGLG